MGGLWSTWHSSCLVLFVLGVGETAKVCVGCGFFSLVTVSAMSAASKKRNAADYVEKHSASQFECLVCSKMYVSKYVARRHVQTVHFQEKSIKCYDPGCEQQFSNYSTARRHALRDHGRGRLQCPSPGCIFESPDFLRFYFSISILN